jgi:hypothetical protein
MIHGLFTACPQIKRGDLTMKRKTPYLGVSLPQCRYCGNYWRPAPGVNANVAYCKRCAKSRHEQAATALGVQRLSRSDFKGGVLLPRRLRSN